MIVKGCCRLGRHDETLSSPVRLVVMRLASGELLALAAYDMLFAVDNNRIVRSKGMSRSTG
jgi:hypothetical protein